jgi:MFS family permease
MREGEAMVPVEPIPLWKNRDYMLLWVGQAVSAIGTQVTQIAFPLLVLALTASPAMAGLVAAARTVPYLLFTLPAGALVDRWDRKLTMILCSAGSALALASVPVAHALGTLTIAQLAIVSFVEGSFAVVFGLSETSALPRVVARSQLPTAVAQHQMQFSVAGIIGPPLGGALYTASPLLPFAVDAASYAASSLSLTAIRARFEGARSAVRRSLWAEIAEGARWLWQTPLVRFMALLTGMIGLALAGNTLLVVVLATQQGASPAVTGTIFAAAGVGGILGAILAPRLQRRLAFGPTIIGLSWCFAAAVFLLSVAPSPLFIVGVLAALAVAVPTYNTVQLTYRLALIPDALQGRVNSVFRLVAQGMNPLGLALTGVLLEVVGPATAALFLAIFLVVIAALATSNRHIRNAPPLPTTNP